MKLTIFAATGGIGKQLLKLAVGAGHDVTAAVRDPAKLGELTGKVEVVKVDLADPSSSALKSAVSAADAVLSALGASSAADAGVATKGTKAIAGAMQEAGVRRIVVVSSAQVGTIPTSARPNPPRHDPGDGVFMRFLLAPLLRSILRQRLTDLAEMEEVLRMQDLDWTAIRPPRLTDNPLRTNYRTSYGQNVRGGGSVSRASVAHLMLAVLDKPETIRQTVSVAD